MAIHCCYFGLLLLQLYCGCSCSGENIRAAHSSRLGQARLSSLGSTNSLRDFNLSLSSSAIFITLILLEHLPAAQI